MCYQLSAITITWTWCHLGNLECVINSIHDVLHSHLYLRFLTIHKFPVCDIFITSNCFDYSLKYPCVFCVQTTENGSSQWSLLSPYRAKRYIPWYLFFKSPIVWIQWIKLPIHRVPQCYNKGSVLRASNKWKYGMGIFSSRICLCWSNCYVTSNFRRCAQFACHCSFFKNTILPKRVSNTFHFVTCCYRSDLQFSNSSHYRRKGFYRVRI